MSPLLFSFVIDSLEEVLNTSKYEIVMGYGNLSINIPALFFADDIIILSNS